MHQDVLQNLDEQILGVIQPYRDVALLENLRDVVVGVELRHQLKMDCYLDAVDHHSVHLHLVYLIYMEMKMVPMFHLVVV